MASFEIGGIGLPAELRGGLRRCAALTQPDVNTSRNRLGHIRLELDHVFEAPVEALRPDVHLVARSEEHTSELPSRLPLVCRLLLEKKKSMEPPCFLPPTLHQRPHDAGKSTSRSSPKARTQSMDA